MKRVLILLATSLALWSAPQVPVGSAHRWFTSPSGNIGCYMDVDSARCDIRQHSWSPPPKPDSCDFDWGSALIVGRTGRGRFGCVSDTVGGAPRQLDYGDSAEVGRFICRSTRAHMRCVNRRNGHGFEVSRSAFDRF